MYPIKLSLHTSPTSATALFSYLKIHSFNPLQTFSNKDFGLMNLLMMLRNSVLNKTVSLCSLKARMHFISQRQVKFYSTNLLMQTNFSYYFSLTTYIKTYSFKNLFKFPLTLIYLSHFSTLTFILIVAS